MLCPHCGADLPDGADFCVTCSSFIEGAPVATAPASSLAATVSALLREGRHPEALAACQSALATTPENGAALACLGDVYSALGQWRAAVDAYRQALKHEPPQPDAIRTKLDAALDAQVAVPTAAPATPGVELRGKNQPMARPPEAESTPTPLLPWLTPARAGIIITLALLVIAGSLILAFRSRPDAYRPPQRAIPLPLDNQEGGNSSWDAR